MDKLSKQMYKGEVGSFIIPYATCNAAWEELRCCSAGQRKWQSVGAALQEGQ